MNLRFFFVVIIILTMSGCASRNYVDFTVLSDPPNAPVDVDGVSVGETPTTIKLECIKKWVGIMYSPDGWDYSSSEYTVKAFPPKGFEGESQAKKINPCQRIGVKSSEIKFDMGLRSVAPTQKFEVISK